MGQQAASTRALELCVLGPLVVRRDGEEVEVPGRRERAVLVLLALTPGRAVATDRLIDLLWGEHPPRTAAKTLQAYISRLRAALDAGSDLIVHRESGYALTLAPERVDAHRFRELLERGRAAARVGDPASAASLLSEGLALWRADGPADLGGTATAAATAAALGEARLAALEERIEADLALGRHDQTIAELEELTRGHPYRERLWGQLMLALYRAGRQAAALDCYRRLRALLAEDLGLDPSPDLVELERRIIGQDPGLAAPAAPGPPANLPLEITDLIGREGELQRLARLLTEPGLVSLVGFGGVGKTRLALRAAGQAPEAFPAGVWWCELAPVSEPAAVPHAVAAALDVHPDGQAPVPDAVVAALATRRLLVVLDSCEHQLGEVRGLVRRMLASCPAVTVLATSRQPLGLPGERVVEVPPLPVDGPGTDPGPAVRLFLARAAAAAPGVADQAPRAVAHICRHLDGLPLAIELAAARVRALPPTEIAHRLDRRFRLLDARDGAAGRHAGLRAAIDWSHDLLEEPDRAVLRRASAFAGPFTLAAAEEVCAGGDVPAGEVAARVAGLADRSLLTVEAGPGVARYRMFETLQAYAGERLVAAEEGEATARAHASYFTELAEALAGQMTGPGEAAAVRQLEAVLADLRLAHARAVARGDADLALRLPTTLYWFAFWGVRSEIFDWATAAAETFSGSDHPLLADILGMAAVGASFRGDVAETRRLAGAAARAGTGGRGGSRFALYARARVGMRAGDLESLPRLAREITALDRRDGDGFMSRVAAVLDVLALAYGGRRREALEVVEEWLADPGHGDCPSLKAWWLYGYGEALSELDPGGAAEMLREAATTARKVHNHMVEGIASVTLSSLAGRFGEPDRALPTFGEVIALWEARGAWTHQWITLRNLVELLARTGQTEAAVALHRASTTSASAPPLFGEQGDRLAALMEQARAELGEAAWTAARRRGAVLGDAEAVAFARATIARARDALPDTGTARDGVGATPGVGREGIRIAPS